MNNNNTNQYEENDTKLSSNSKFAQKSNTAPNPQNNQTTQSNVPKAPHLPLQYAWTLWHTAPSSQAGGWTEDYKPIAHFSTVEEFWRLFNNISPPSLLDLGSSYHLFKGKVRPAWEDPFNKNGGAWAFRLSNFDTGANANANSNRGMGGNRNGKRSDPLHAANYAWYHTVLNMIGNNFKYSEDIAGLIINIKRGRKGKLELWITEASDREKVIAIGKQFKDFSFSGPTKKARTDIEFMSFEDSKNKNRNNKIKL